MQYELKQPGHLFLENVMTNSNCLRDNTIKNFRNI